MRIEHLLLFGLVLSAFLTGHPNTTRFGRKAFGCCVLLCGLGLILLCWIENAKIAGGG